MSLWDYLKLDLVYWSWIGTSLLSLNFALIGTTLVEKRMTLMGDTLSHAILPGVVLSQFIWGSSLTSLLAGGWVSGFTLLLLTQLISRSRRVYQDSSFAFLALFFVAIGMVISFKTKTSPEILHLLFGQALSFELADVIVIGVITLLTLAFFISVRHLWSLWIVDPQLFQSGQVSSLVERGLLLAGLSLMMTHLTVGLKSLGAFMTVGLIVIPALISQQIDHRLYRRLFFAGLVSVLTSLFSVVISISLDWPLGPTVVILLSLTYILVLWLQPKPRELSRP
jgi:zinc/manganese transport system permease protein